MAISSDLLSVAALRGVNSIGGNLRPFTCAAISGATLPPFAGSSLAAAVLIGDSFSNAVSVFDDSAGFPAMFFTPCTALLAIIFACSMPLLLNFDDAAILSSLKLAYIVASSTLPLCTPPAPPTFERSYFCSVSVAASAAVFAVFILSPAFFSVFLSSQSTNPTCSSNVASCNFLPFTSSNFFCLSGCH